MEIIFDLDDLSHIFALLLTRKNICYLIGWEESKIPLPFRFDIVIWFRKRDSKILSNYIKLKGEATMEL